MEVTLRASSHPEGRSSCALSVGSNSRKYDIVALSLAGLIVVGEGFGGEPLVVVVNSLGSLPDGFVHYLARLLTHLYRPSRSRAPTLPTPAQLASGSPLRPTLARKQHQVHRRYIPCNVCNTSSPGTQARIRFVPHFSMRPLFTGVRGSGILRSCPHRPAPHTKFGHTKFGCAPRGY